MNNLTNTSFAIDNLKCSGCANTITKALQSFTGLRDAHIDVENSLVSFAYEPGVDIGAVKDKLATLGYPESGTAEGLSKVLGVAKSYVSCAIGKLS
jgi:copper chaperone CopZ